MYVVLLGHTCCFFRFKMCGVCSCICFLNALTCNATCYSCIRSRATFACYTSCIHSCILHHMPAMFTCTHACTCTCLHSAPWGHYASIMRPNPNPRGDEAMHFALQCHMPQGKVCTVTSMYNTHLLTMPLGGHSFSCTPEYGACLGFF